MGYFIWFVLACCTCTCLSVYGQSLPPCMIATNICTGEGDTWECSNRGLTDVPCDFPCETRAINLTYNSIEVLYGDAFKFKLQCRGLQQNLEMLDLSDNRIDTIHHDFFDPLESLQKLVLSRNFLELLKPGVFRSMGTLEHLDLSRNHLTSVSSDLFAGIENLHYLFLANNLLQDVGDALGVLPFLITINLLDNRIANLSDQAFVDNSKLEDIELGGNKLTHVPCAILEANGDLKNSLRHLDLHGNQISTVNSESFGSLSHLEELDLSSNALDTIESNSFFNLPDLNKLRLNGNRLTTIHKSAVDGNRELKNIYLHDNPWMCNCDVIGLWRHLRANTSRVDIYSPAAVLCQNPRTLNKRKLSDVSMDSTYNCQDMPAALSQTDIIIISAAAGGVLLLVIIALVIVVVCYKKKGKKEEPARNPPNPPNVYDDGLYLTPSVAGSQSNISREELHQYDVPIPLLKTNEAHTYESPPIKPINHSYEASLTPTNPKKLYKSKSDQKINQGYDDDGYAQADEMMN